jgi:hypothetical protein
MNTVSVVAGALAALKEVGLSEVSVAGILGEIGGMDEVVANAIAKELAPQQQTDDEPMPDEQDE